MASSTSTIAGHEPALYAKAVAPVVSSIEHNWYAAYTRANHEKCVASQLAERGVEHFLPLYSSVRRWKDRKVRLQLPLFPGYLFVNLASQERIRVLQVPGVVQLVGCHGHPTPLPEEDIIRIRELLRRGCHAEPHPFLTVGRRVRLTAGPFAGLNGILKRKKNCLRVVLSLEVIHRSMVVEVDLADVAPAS